MNRCRNSSVTDTFLGARHGPEPTVLKDAPPLPGEEARYGQIVAVLAAAKSDPALAQAMIDEATKTEKDLIETPLRR